MKFLWVAQYQYVRILISAVIVIFRRLWKDLICYSIRISSIECHLHECQNSSMWMSVPPESIRNISMEQPGPGCWTGKPKQRRENAGTWIAWTIHLQIYQIIYHIKGILKRRLTRLRQYIRQNKRQVRDHLSRNLEFSLASGNSCASNNAPCWIRRFL